MACVDNRTDDGTETTGRRSWFDFPVGRKILHMIEDHCMKNKGDCRETDGLESR